MIYNTIAVSLRQKSSAVYTMLMGDDGIKGDKQYTSIRISLSVSIIKHKAFWIVPAIKIIINKKNNGLY